MLSAEFFAHYRVRQDHWHLDYAPHLQWTEPSLSQENIDPDIECASAHWAPRPAQSSAPRAQELFPLCVVDGVRRLHQRLVLEREEGLWYGGMGSIAIGALEIWPGHMCTVEEALISAHVERFALFGGVDTLFTEPLQVPGIPLAFQPILIHEENSPTAPVEALHKRMRMAEDHLVRELQNNGQLGLILVDGPLQYHRLGRQGAVVGFIKSQRTRYLPLELQKILMQLKPGERTPLFAIGSETLSWYLNLGHTQLTDHALSGVIRLEIASSEIQAVIHLADLLQSHLPVLATTRFQDPRSPQNLVPIQALETLLRRRIGDETLIQRLLEARLYQYIQTK